MVLSCLSNLHVAFSSPPLWRHCSADQLPQSLFLLPRTSSLQILVRRAAVLAPHSEVTVKLHLFFLLPC